MPRLKQPKEVNADLQALLVSKMFEQRETYQDIANCMTITAQTLSRKIHSPGKMSLDELRCVCKVLGIEGKELSTVFMRW